MASFLSHGLRETRTEQPQARSARLMRHEICSWLQGPPETKWPDLSGMRKNWFLSRNEEEAILDLTQRYDDQQPKVRKIFLRRKNLAPRSFLCEIIEFQPYG